MPRLTITFDENEVAALRSAAIKAMRPTKDQARFIIRSFLLGEQSQDSNKSVTASNLAERTVNGLVNGNP